MTKSDRAKQKSTLKIKALQIVIFISVDNLVFGLKSINNFLEIIRSIYQPKKGFDWIEIIEIKSKIRNS